MHVIGTAGHVDHGKSTLVKALTGIDPDRLREEKERGLTIDLGFAWIELPSGREVSIVDVPGHERFIKNMLAGAGGVDLALLVVAADEGPMPQTREHLAILDLLDVPAGIVVLTRTDLVESEYVDLVEAELEDVLAGSRLESAPILRVCATSGEGIEALKLAIDAALDATPPKRDLGRPRLPIDRAFTIQGFGVVVTGTLVHGALSAGQEVELQPGGLRARIRGLQRHRTKVDRLDPGTRAAVNLSGLHIEDIRRGMVVAAPGSVTPARVLDVRLRATPMLAHPLAHDAGVTVLSATAESEARLRLLDSDALLAGEAAWAQLVLDQPMPALPGDHCIVRTPNDTVAGGVIVAVNAKRRRRNHAPTMQALDRLLQGSPADRILDRLLAGPAAPADLAPHAGDDAHVVSTALESLLASGTVVRAGGKAVAAAWLSAQAGRLAGAVSEYLQANPLRLAAPREHVRGSLRLDPSSFDLVVSHAVASGTLSEARAGLAPPGYEPALTPVQHREAEAFLAGIREGGASPPTDRLPPPPLLAYLADRGLVVDTGAGVVFDAAVFADMLERTRRHISATGAISLAEVRDLFATSRKYAQAFLEHLDALHITRRSGDARTLR
ncbi:MAG: selenocysteine-specific translation elongation factor [Chloroflexi bacterium]|nr:selenocysteine-specific translation elongation factor [Dehalococcoidia bacterium]MCO5200981.1 selenocysteine-specific translation elongation factor [Chloroflexota bacterium]MCZ7578902.1 selenocysteine-specific translation elongation factor [Dehalococcoidia bacterium]